LRRPPPRKGARIDGLSKGDKVVYIELCGITVQFIGKFGWRKLILLDRKKAMKLWEQSFERDTEARDYRNRIIFKAAYGQHGSKYGWDVHHKVPKNRGGTDAFENLQIVHVATHDEIHGR
jgi:hypothetical protein